VVTFTFDDAPRTAFDTGSAILEAHGARGTFFVCLGLLSRTTEIGRIAGAGELAVAVERGHELGCHTFDHSDAWETASADYIASIDRNRAALARALPGRTFRTFAYPRSGATAAVKPALSERFDCCRGGGQCGNVGVVDLNLLASCFVDHRAALQRDAAFELIDHNAEHGGWLVFSAHDVSEDAGPFSCSADFLDAIVRQATRSGALVLPMAQALDHFRSHASSDASRGVDGTGA
jgi:peptidoglycan/xylan/chitin deacetylase (PgdA/CDA1 family)